MPRANGCLETYRSFKGLPVPAEEETPANQEIVEMFAASFFPDDVIEWMSSASVVRNGLSAGQGFPRSSAAIGSAAQTKIHSPIAGMGVSPPIANAATMAPYHQIMPTAASSQPSTSEGRSGIRRRG